METAQTSDPLGTAILIGFIVSLLGVLYRELRGQIADRDAQIKKLEEAMEKAAERSASLAASADRMLTFFLDREELMRSISESSDPGKSP